MTTKVHRGNNSMGAKDRPKKAESPGQPKNESQALLANALGQIEKTFGKGSIMKLTEEAGAAVQGISTGALSLDLALGGRGFPRGRVIELFGPESSGKTTLALHAIAMPSAREASPHLSMRSTPSTRHGPSGWESIWKICLSASRPTARKDCRSPRCSSAPIRSTLL